MSIMVKYAAPHITRDIYASLRQALDWDAHPPQGALLHVACFDDAGGLQSVDIWESQAHLDAYVAERLGKALTDLGLPEATPEVFEVDVAAAAPEIDAFVLPVLRKTPAAETRSFQAHVPERPI